MSFSAYLVGSWESRFGVGTALQIINPTLDHLEVIVAFFDDNEHCLKTMNGELSPNDMWEVVVPKLEKQFGVAKIISHRDKEIMPGIVGFQRHVLAIPTPTEIAFSEAPLAAIPEKYAADELKKILAGCP
ncbi:hypothetical protein [Desulfosediminicola flagellatus]|uniref:hypothetical protein n=1 Tax=Desulfosediminicola flagellatus TaxID=2569541 RepID=UPI0010AD1DF4|nr:hypothetical protein [Desulfosediminicola flagellatus]